MNYQLKIRMRKGLMIDLQFLKAIYTHYQQNTIYIIDRSYFFQYIGGLMSDTQEASFRPQWRNLFT